MANDRMYIRCKGCGDLHYLAKCYDDGYFTTHEGEELRQGLDDFFDRHKWCYDKYYGGFELVYESDEDAESDDERIIKTIRQLLETARDAHSNTSLAKPFIDALAWLEKQKENPKSADSIPEDCTSDAKCEDRWHKVGDSLPNNPREVLCKDEAGNYFIGRYYTDEGWEISNYDDEDKPHHLNPPVLKWIDFPSEKQKEPENTSASTMAPSCWGEEQGKVELVNDLEEDALLLERAWLTLDGFGHEELAGRLRQFAERKGLIWK